MKWLVAVLVFLFLLVTAASAWRISDLLDQIRSLNSEVAKWSNEYGTLELKESLCRGRENLLKGDVDRLKKKIAFRESRYRNPSAETKEMLCQIEIINWMGRVEGFADVPEGTMKTIAERGEPKLTDRQHAAMYRGIRKFPPPKCVNIK